MPNSIVVSRGCPHVCDFCYKVAFFQGGRQFYTQAVDAALAEIDRLPGRHLYFLDDHLFGDAALCRGTIRRDAGMGRLWQAAGTVKTVLEQPELLEKAVGRGPSQPVRWLRNRECCKPGRAAQVPEHRPGLRCRGAQTSRPGRDGQRELRLRHGPGSAPMCSSARSSGQFSKAWRRQRSIS